MLGWKAVCLRRKFFCNCPLQLLCCSLLHLFQFHPLGVTSVTLLRFLARTIILVFFLLILMLYTFCGIWSISWSSSSWHSPSTAMPWVKSKVFTISLPILIHFFTVYFCVIITSYVLTLVATDCIAVRHTVLRRLLMIVMDLIGCYDHIDLLTQMSFWNLI